MTLPLALQPGHDGAILAAFAGAYVCARLRHRRADRPRNGFTRLAWAAVSALFARAAGVPMAIARALLALSTWANARAKA